MKQNGDFKKKLLDVPPEHAFWVNNGPIPRNVYELLGALKAMRQETYEFHTNNGKNDFANWARDIIGDNLLAAKLLGAKNARDAAKKLGAWIKSTEKKAV